MSRDGRRPCIVDEIATFLTLNPHEVFNVTGQLRIMGSHHRDDPDKVVAFQIAQDGMLELVWYKPEAEAEKVK